MSRFISSAFDSTKDGLRSISLAAPSVALALLVAGVIEKMLLLSDCERKGVFPFPVTAAILVLLLLAYRRQRISIALCVLAIST